MIWGYQGNQMNTNDHSSSPEKKGRDDKQQAGSALMELQALSSHRSKQHEEESIEAGELLSSRKKFGNINLSQNKNGNSKESTNCQNKAFNRTLINKSYGRVGSDNGVNVGSFQNINNLSNLQENLSGSTQVESVIDSTSDWKGDKNNEQIDNVEEWIEAMNREREELVKQNQEFLQLFKKQQNEIQKIKSNHIQQQTQQQQVDVDSILLQKQIERLNRQIEYLQSENNQLLGENKQLLIQKQQLTRENLQIKLLQQTLEKEIFQIQTAYNQLIAEHQSIIQRQNQNPYNQEERRLTNDQIDDLLQERQSFLMEVERQSLEISHCKEQIYKFQKKEDSFKDLQRDYLELTEHVDKLAALWSNEDISLEGSMSGGDQKGSILQVNIIHHSSKIEGKDNKQEENSKDRVEISEKRRNACRECIDLKRHLNLICKQHEQQFRQIKEFHLEEQSHLLEQINLLQIKNSKLQLQLD